ncbi:hypothetical protein GCM10007291_00690 [Gemmobacter nanjingensis]|uniref:OmpA-like domain-containing protein n=1 Tax=Gemmobacter nanjingensis TaxID=488454 RepID=A0ABQ3F671_9RHOB|nr:OmpA family protein [Gemmobacter nanjingensis]GHC08606.1 hypothetical protein GCM10007291_00690 [Gemmobacter nanjingensis]
MNRILNCTTALAVALAGINPAALSAQTRVQVQGQTVVCLPDKKTACPDGANCIVVKNPANCEKRAFEKFGGGSPERKNGEGAEQPKKKKAAAEQDAAPAKKKAADEPVKKQKKAAEEQKPAKEKKADKPVKEKKAEKKEKKDDKKDKVVPKAPTRSEAVAPVEEPQVKVPSGAPRSSDNDNAPTLAPDTSVNTANTAPAEQKPRKQRKPRAEEDQAILDVLGSEPAAQQADTTQKDGTKKRRNSKKPEKPEAALVPSGAPRSGDDGPQVTESRVTREDRRDASRDYDTPVIGDQQTAKKDSGGLSKLEKAGLLALGALAVGTLLKNGNKVVSNTGDRVVVDRGYGDYVVLKDDDALIREPGSNVRTETYRDGSTRTTVDRADGTQIITIRDASGRVLRRARINLDGSQTLLIDDLSDRVQEVDVTRLPKPQPGLAISTSGEDAALRARMLSLRAAEAGRSFSLAQIRDYPEVRALAPTVDVDNITFETGSAAIRPSEAEKLSQLGEFMSQMIEENPGEMFLIEGHTDAVGDAAYNLALSDRRAESVALALTEYFDVPAENMVVQGYGEGELRIASAGDEPRNRRAVVRMISPLMRQLASN